MKVLPQARPAAPSSRSQPGGSFSSVLPGFGQENRRVDDERQGSGRGQSRRGRPGIFAGLVERYRYAVFGLCLNYTRDFDAAEDAAQEAFIKAFLKLRTLEAGDRFAPWLRQIAVNECRMGYRRRAEPLPESVEKSLVSPAGTPEEEAIAVEDRRAVLTALGTLGEEQQQLITLFYLEGLSQKEIAAFLDLAPQAVNQRLYRARNHLRKEMLNMVEEVLGGGKLPDGFTDEVIRTAPRARPGASRRAAVDRGQGPVPQGDFHGPGESGCPAGPGHEPWKGRCKA